MKRHILFLTFLPWILSAEVRPALMPLPKKMEFSSGALRIDTRFRVAFASQPEARLERAARRMIAQLSRQTGMLMEPSIVPDAGAATLVIECQETVDRPDTLGQSEIYRLEISPSQARLSAATVVGALRGLQTFLQLIVPGESGFVAPAVRIEDEPRFAWRGLLIDVTSHFMPVPVIERNLDAMEAVKLNVFHWHLTDDQGWRVESKLYPKLHQLGSGGNYYTQDEIRHLLAYAHDRGIRILPEFDMPGHCATWLIGYPELASAPGPYSIIHTFGVYDPALDPTKENVYQFIDGLIGEMGALFPDPYFHIGGDEVNGKQWKANPDIQSFIREHNLHDEAGLQTYFNQRVEALVKKHGKTMMGWDEVLHPDLPQDIVVQSWRDRESMMKAAHSGHRVLLSWGYYLDHLDSAAKSYEVDPLGGPAQDLTAAEVARVLGGEACIWTEYTSPETIDSRIWPRTAAVAERLWSSAEASDRASMYHRLDRISDWLDWRGVKHQSNYSPMLQRLAPGAPLSALTTLGDAVEPLGIDGREGHHAYNQKTPLNRLVDAARAESVPVRQLEERMGRYLLSPSAGDEMAIRRQLEIWRDNHARLREALNSSFLLKETVPLSEDLSRLGEIGLEALNSLCANRAVPSDWLGPRLEALERMEKPRAEVVLAAVRPVRLLLKKAGTNGGTSR
jgi:hexosaminidase